MVEARPERPDDAKWIGIDLTTFAIGLDLVKDGRHVMHEIVSKNKPIPCSFTYDIMTVEKN